MKKIFHLFAFFLFLTACVPSEKMIQEPIVQTQTTAPIVTNIVTSSVTSTSTGMPTIIPTSQISPTCSVGIAGVMDVFQSHGYLNFTENKNGSGVITLVQNELDSSGYGRMVGVQYNADYCVLQIKALVVEHIPPTDTEANLDSSFMTTAEIAGLTDSQANNMLDWLQSANRKNMLSQAIKIGKASDTVHLSPPSDYPFDETTYEFFSDRLVITEVIVFQR